VERIGMQNKNIIHIDNKYKNQKSRWKKQHYLAGGRRNNSSGT